MITSGCIKASLSCQRGIVMVSYHFTVAITLYDLFLAAIIEFSFNVMRAIHLYIIMYARLHD